MGQFIPAPNPLSLLPPLLACLPTAFASPRPPPAVLPLLSPILRQRVQLLSAGTATSSGSWLHLLCWKPADADKLAQNVESDAFEPHPVSGEIELGDVDQAEFRRLDQETLQSRLKVRDLGLLIIYAWCEGDQEGGGTGWRVSELKPIECISEESTEQWWHSVSEADNNVNYAQKNGTHLDSGWPEDTVSAPDEGEEDNYWAQYDETPGRTPAMNRSRSPLPKATPQNDLHVRTTSEAEYYAQYARVQPEMDNDDPSEDREAIGNSTLSGNVIVGSIAHQTLENKQAIAELSLPNRNAETIGGFIVHPRPSSSSASSASVARLEESVSHESHAEIAVQQHVSTSMKSLFRLARGAGISTEEFDRLVRTELETLSMMEDD